VRRRGACEQLEWQDEARTPDRARCLDAGEYRGKSRKNWLRDDLDSRVSSDAQSAIGMKRVLKPMRVGGGECSAKNHKRNAQQAKEELPPWTHA